MASSTVTQFEWNSLMTSRLKAIYSQLFVVMAIIGTNLYFSKDGVREYGYMAVAWMLILFITLRGMSLRSNSELTGVFSILTPVHCILAFSFVWVIGYNLINRKDWNSDGSETERDITGIEMVHRLLMLFILIAMAFFGWLLSAYAKQTPPAQTKRHELFSTVGALGGIFMMTYLTMAILILFKYLDGSHIEWTRGVLLVIWLTVFSQWLRMFSLWSESPCVLQIHHYRVWALLSVVPAAFQLVSVIYAVQLAFKENTLALLCPDIVFKTTSHARLFRDIVYLICSIMMTVLSALLAECYRKLIQASIVTV